MSMLSRCIYSAPYILEINYMENPARMEGKCFTFHRWSIKVSLVHHRHPSCFRHSIFLSSESLGKSKSVFNRLNTFRETVVHENVLSPLNEHFRRCVSPRDARRVRRRSLTFALSWVRLSCTTAPRISRLPRVILAMKGDAQREREREGRGRGKEGLEERKNDGESSQRARLMRPKVEQTAARTRYFKASFTGKIDLIEGIALETRIGCDQPSRAGGQRRDLTHVFVLTFRI